MVVAAVTSHLANSMKQQTEIARKREKEMGDLYAFSRRLAAASSAADIYRAIEEHLANLVQRKVVLFGAGAGGQPEPRQTAAAGARACRHRGRAGGAHALHHRRRRSRRHLARAPRLAARPPSSA